MRVIAIVKQTGVLIGMSLLLLKNPFVRVVEGKEHG